ncbi:hypothetical protein A3E46_01280 [Candidatus Woesebacteria bacterium RIFCSPHIGHO2_12_FULL_46_16]|uniref:Uncharacterized protein n=1 Tax=Candidatus Woesebacteria bacterium RIFCSPHIGHO2_12_FULL_46_16 TaxID=1802513 RepID=A0A1F8B0Q2_9BACT|nr:MAG: hypothetical protein A3E46_01280 [Candidatus Woesebacteria bacterium RIFCSPHIGHO2_12_FULL_46_16]
MLSQQEIPLGNPLRGIGPLGNPQGTGITEFNKFISTTIGLMTIIAIIWFVFKFVAGAIGIISSGGDKASLETAKKNITTGVIGLVVVVAALFIVDLIGNLIGIPNILNLVELFQQIQQ